MQTKRKTAASSHALAARTIRRRITGDATRRAESLADRLEMDVSKRALAEAMASRAVVAGIIDGRTDAQIAADVFAELRRYEQIAALRSIGRKGGHNDGDS